MNSTTERSLKYLSWVAVVIILFTSFSLLSMVNGVQNQQAEIREQQKIGRQINLENNAYHRTVACILSVPLADRTDDYISNCYLKGEQEAGVRVDHFGNK